MNMQTKGEVFKQSVIYAVGKREITFHDVNLNCQEIWKSMIIWHQIFFDRIMLISQFTYAIYMSYEYNVITNI